MRKRKRRLPSCSEMVLRVDGKGEILREELTLIGSGDGKDAGAKGRGETSLKERMDTVGVGGGVGDLMEEMEGRKSGILELGTERDKVVCALWGDKMTSEKDPYFLGLLLLLFVEELEAKMVGGVGWICGMAFPGARGR